MAANIYFLNAGPPAIVFEHNYTFNNRFQPIDIQDWDQTWYASNHGSSPPPCTAIADSPEEEFHITYSYTDASGHNNGNVIQINNNQDMHRTQQFSYDSLNRLATANTLTTNQPWFQGDTGALANCWGEQFNYDPWGNLAGISPVSSAYTGCTQENWSMTPTTKNQLQDTNNDYVYDAAGNLINPGPIGGPYVFDAENHLISAGGLAYLYDGDGKRVGKAPSGTPTQPNYLYWYGAGPQILEETDGAGNYLYDNFYFNGMLLARGEPDNWVDHFMADALGNARCVYGDGDPDGGCSDYYPFGGERPIHGVANSYGVNVPFKFTGKERDYETGLDNFGARYNSSSLGRFMSPDPLYIEAHRLADPQRLNLYAYARNNPVNLTDPTGLDVALKCDTRENCIKAVNDFNSRKNAQFKVELGKDGKLHVVKGSLAKSLSKAEGALLGAINDASNHATINVSGNTGQSEFGVHDSRGVNSVDLENLSKLDAPSNAGGLNSGDALAHEAMDAYYSLSMGAEAADWAAAGLFPGLFMPTNVHIDRTSGVLFGQTSDQAISNGTGTERVTIQYVTPIPFITLNPHQIQGAERAAGSRVTEVTFVPPKQ